MLLGVLTLVHLYKTRNHPSGAAPVISARQLDGTPVTLGGPGEGPLLLHFWATWCGVCRMEESSVEALSKGARVLSVAVSSGSADEVRAYMTEHGLSFAVINDPNRVLARKFGVAEYPTSLFLSSSGNIVTSEVGFTTRIGLELRLWLAGVSSRDTRAER
jgi:thiol-disulfide isomerase/thioredoxin